MISGQLKGSRAVLAFCMGKQGKGDCAIVDLGRANHYRYAVSVRYRFGRHLFEMPSRASRPAPSREFGIRVGASVG